MSSITSPRRRSPSVPLHQQASLTSERTRREKRLYEASLGGCVESLAQLLQEDRLILARASVTCFDETPLHVACMLGHVPFAKALLAHKRDLAMELDSQGRTPLHWASANGYVEIARELLQSNPLACLVHDEDGWTPLHLATMKGRSNIVIELVKARPEVAEHRLSHGQTALHLGVSHNRLEALKVLVETMRDGDLVKAQDDEGNTILHLATANKQIETVKYLLQIREVDMNTMNRNGFSALDIVEYFPKDFKVIELRELLVHAGALRAIRFPASTTHQVVVDNRNEENSTVVVDLASAALPSTNTPPLEAVPPPSFSGKIRKQKGDKHEKWIKKKRDSLMVML
ncbi:ankyrin repeat-containing protein BDA1-like [Eucalyptus grandis]|uniref:ankyrin repeat-containing protein BDA1-like n=1 Tax=Eucalyptus grandis TaxID=71139 RepID=UPI00192E9015|nr:ankyrin repeat-containing protein BDA1-like [Eucalyptus grandis]